MNRQSPRPPVAKKRNGLRGSKGALAPKKPFLSKRLKPKPPNPAYAEFGYRLPLLLAALAPKKPQLTKRLKPKPPNSAYAEFGNQIAGSISENHTKAETGVQSQNSANAEFWSFCAFAERNAVFFGKTRSQRRHLEAVAKVLQMRTKHFRNCE